MNHLQQPPAAPADEPREPALSFWTTDVVEVAAAPLPADYEAAAVAAESLARALRDAAAEPRSECFDDPRTISAGMMVLLLEYVKLGISEIDVRCATETRRRKLLPKTTGALRYRVEVAWHQPPGTAWPLVAALRESYRDPTARVE